MYVVLIAVYRRREIVAEILTDTLQFIGVFLGLQALALLLCVVFFPWIPIAVAGLLVRALSPGRRSSARQNSALRTGRSHEDEDLDLVVVLQGVEDSARHGSK